MTKATPAQATAPAAGAQTNLFLDMVPLSDLRFGHDRKGKSVNARISNRTEVKALAQSIREVGLIVPLVAMKDAAGTYVIEGNRRLAALHILHKPTEHGHVRVPVYFGAGGVGVDPLEVSMIANVERVALHPVDRFEVFAEMIERGATVEGIGSRYMLTVPQVRQALSLARMAPEVRDAWREGKINAGIAEAFAESQDHDHQRRVLKKVGKHASSYMVQREISGGGHDAPRPDSLLKFVGRDAYEKAGHHVNVSLFSDNQHDTDTVSNAPALRAMAEAKIDAEVERLEKDGWGFAMRADKAPKDIGAWRRLPSSSPSKEQKAAAGCTVKMSWEGKLEVTRGYIKPGTSIKIPQSAAQKKATQKAKATKDESGGISGGLALRLSTAMSLAASEALRKDGALALRSVIAALASEGEGPVRISGRGLAGLDDDSDVEPYAFDKYLALTERKSPGQLLEQLAVHVAQAIDLRCHSASSMPLTGESAEEDRALLESIEPDDLNEALRKHFDAEDYFKSVATSMSLAAIKQMGGIAPAKGSKKAVCAAMATTMAKAQGWLPIELRTKFYDGPGAKEAKAAAAAKAAKAKGSKKKKARR